MAMSVPTRRGPPYATASVPVDEDYINRSLLDSVNAQGDAEPGLSDSEAPGVTISTFAPMANATSVSPHTVPYPISSYTQQQRQQASHPDSPDKNNILPSYLQSPPLNADSYSQGPQNSQLYNSLSSLSSSEHDALNSQTKANGFSPAGTFRTTAVPFSAFPGRARQNTTSYRDTSSYASPPFPSTQADIYISTPHIPQSQQSPPNASFDPLNSGRYDFGLNTQQSGPSLIGNGQVKQSAGFSAMDAYRLGLEPALPSASQQIKPSASLGGGPPGLMRDAAVQSLSPVTAQQGFAAQLNSLGVHQLSQMQSQAYAAHPAVNGPGPSASSAQGNTGASSSQQQQPQEEISTIFVVGFPDDMTEREFQNMFTFSSGFEAATLKIPNRDYNSSGGAGMRSSALPSMHYGGSNDPYNIVTVNQGGVVVDGRDGTTSWPAPQMSFMDDGHFVPTGMPVQPPRKQIIGFAKFRTRQEALEARDVLQGRRVDIEKGSVLKAEMAKKNLHTKRGPGMGSMGVNSLMSSQGAGAGGNTAVQQEQLGGSGLGGSVGGSAAGEVFMQREKELGLGPMTIAGLGQRRGTIGEREDVLGLTPFGTRGARERAEEDERERERKRKDKEAQRLRQNSYAFEAFHSVPQQMVRQGANSLLSAENGAIGDPVPLRERGHTLSAQSSMQSIGSQIDSSGPWPTLRDVASNPSLRKMSMGLASLVPNHPPTPPEDSPVGEVASPRSGAQSASGSTNPSAPFSPQSISSVLPMYGGFQSYARASSPGVEGHVGAADTGSMPTSSASSVNGGNGYNGDDLARVVDALAVSTEQKEGTVSPQLPSPASGTSSTHGRNPGDQNPPINTLYVGNLPSAPSPGGSPPMMLEDRLRELFSKRPGYRKLCFRQKSNGPMCFVEFEDVSYATRALNELHGDTLGGLIKGGIRLSYSKNPLGVRTPTGGSNGPSLQQQQQAFYSTANTTQNTMDDFRFSRRDTSGLSSPTSSYYYSMSPPPRFAASPPAASFTSSLSNSAMYPRANQQGFSLSSGPSPTFSPFGISPSHSSIPDQPSAESSNDQFTHTFTSANIEASRAG